MPIVVITAPGDGEERRIAALEAGADDVVAVPVSDRELVARVRAGLRRSPIPSGDPVVFLDDLEIDFAAHVVRRRGRDVHLTPIEFSLLRVLVRNRGRVVPHRALLEEIWGPDQGDDLPALRTCVARLRHKIEPRDGHRVRHIHTTAGIGYRFSAR